MHTPISIALIVAAVLAIGLPAAALDLDQAKAAGLVGEKPDGYVAAVAATPSPEVKALVDDVNAKRRTAYDKVARQNGAPVSAVAAIAGKKLIEGAPSGTFVQVDGKWMRRQ